MPVTEAPLIGKVRMLRVDATLPSPRTESAELPSAVRRDEIAMIGIGAGNLGIILHLDARKQLDAAFGRGMGFYDARSFGAGTLNLACTSNSSGSDFAESISTEGDFAKIRQKSSMEGESNVVDLRAANGMYQELGQALEEKVAASTKSGIVRRRISHIIFNPNHTEQNERFELYSYNDVTERDELVGFANKVVLGTGATQRLSISKEFRDDLDKKLVATAEEILAGDQENLQQLFETLEGMDPDKRKITILGGSHGAFATASEILKYNDRRVDLGKENIFEPGSITILSKNSPKIYAKDREEARDIYGEDNLDEGYFSKDNGSYNRFGGIRAGSRDLLMRMRTKVENRVQFVVDPARDDLWLDSRLDDVPVIIQAFGPTTNVVPILTRDDKAIAKFDDRGNIMVGARGNILTEEGDDIGLFGIGIGYPPQEVAPHIAKLAGPKENPQTITAANAYVSKFGPVIAEQLGFKAAA